LIDNAKTDLDLIAKLIQGNSSIRYIRLKKNLNYGGANNYGMSRALKNDADYILIINPDIWLENDAVHKMMESCENNQDLGIVSALQLEYNSDSWSKWARHHVVCTNDSKIVHCDWLEGSCLMLTKKVMAVTGGFDQIYQMYYEDLDLCRRANMGGFSLGVIMDAKYHHHSNATYIEELNPKRLTRIDTSQFIYNLTDPTNHWMSNLAKTLKWCIRRKYQWLRGKRPGFATTLIQIVGLIINNYGNLKNKWNERRSGNLRTNIDMNPQLVELEL